MTTQEQQWDEQWWTRGNLVFLVINTVGTCAGVDNIISGGGSIGVGLHLFLTAVCLAGAVVSGVALWKGWEKKETPR